jgi:hypothetical protein
MELVFETSTAPTRTASGLSPRFLSWFFYGVVLLSGFFSQASVVTFTGGTVYLNSGSAIITNGSGRYSGVNYYQEGDFILDYIGGADFDAHVGDYYRNGNDVIHGHWLGSLSAIEIHKVSGGTFDFNYFVLTSNTRTGGGSAVGNEVAYVQGYLNGVPTGQPVLLPPDNWGFPSQQVYFDSAFDVVDRVVVYNADSYCFGMDEFYFDEAAPPPVIGSQYITFPEISTKRYGDPMFSLGATASSGLPVTYTCSNSSVATVSSSGLVTNLGVGTATITASQSGNFEWNPAITVIRTLTVEKGNQLISFGLLPNKTTDDAPFTLSAFSNSDLPISYSSSNTSVATVVGNTVTLMGAGTTTITARQSGNSNWNEATPVSRTLQVTFVNKLPVIVTPSALNGIVGTFSSIGITANGATPLTFSATNLPTNLTINANSGLISGTPTTAGSGTATITAINAYGTNSTSLAWTIASRTLLTISGATVSNKVYDGGRGASVNWSRHTLVGVGVGHDVSLVTSGAVATYDSANAGVGKSVSVTGLTLAGADVWRYEIDSVLRLSGDILKKNLTITNLFVQDKRYDNTVSAPLDWGSHVLTGHISGEEPSVAQLEQPYTSAYYANAEVGTNKPVLWPVQSLSLTGTGKDNYTLLAPTNLTGTIWKGWIGIEIQGTNQVYGRTNRVVTVATANLVGANPVLEVIYEGINGTEYGPSTNGPIHAGQYRVVARVDQTDNTYEGSINGTLTIQKLRGMIRAVSDTIRAGTVFSGTRYTGSGFLPGDEPTGILVTHLRSVGSINPLVSYDPARNESGVYRILRGNVGDDVSKNYTIEYREGTLTVLKASYLTEGSVMPLAAGLNYTLVVQNNGTNNPTLRAFGSNSVVVSNLPTILTDGTAEVAGVGSGSAANFGMAWMRDGAGKVWGSQNQTLSNVVGMAGAATYAGYVKENGTVGIWGSGSNVPTVPAALTNSNTAGVLTVAAGQDYLLALRTNGSVTAWGTAGYGLTNPPTFSNAVAVAAGNYNGVVVKGDGTVATWGNNTFEGTTVPAQLTNRLTNTFVRAVSAVAGYQYTLVLRADGTVRGWGSGSPTNLPAALTNTMVTNPIVSLAVEQHHAVAMQRDGTVTTWLPTAGLSNKQTLTVPTGLKGLVPIGGADSDGDGWANEAELRVGSDPLSQTSQPVKASFGVNFAYGTNPSTFTNSKTVGEGSNRVVGTLQILDTMGRLEDGNQTEMTVELSEESLKTFEPVSRTNRELRFKTNPVYDGVTGNNIYWVDVLVRDATNTATLATTLNVTVGNTPPQLIGNTSFSLNENVPVGTAVGMLQASETGVVWSLADNDLFAIEVQSGVITTKAPIDYEALLSSKTITLRATVTDAGGAQSSEDVMITIVDVLEGMTWDLWLGGAARTPELLLKYAIGGASSPTGSSEKAVTLFDSTKLSLTAIVRTDDPSLSVVGEAGMNLSSLNTNGVSVAASANQASVPEGCERRIYSVDRANSPSKQFLRVRVTR